MYPASQPGSKRHTLSVLVENRPGVLARIAGLFARRAFNINSLSVLPHERPDISRVTVTADVDEVPLEQIIKQLNKLLHVLKIVDLDPNTTVERELVLIKVTADESNRSDVLEIVRLFRVRVVDVNPESLTIEATGAEGKIDALLGLLEHYGIIELVRSGAVAVTRGPKALSEKVLGSEITEPLIQSANPNLQASRFNAGKPFLLSDLRLRNSHLTYRNHSSTNFPLPKVGNRKNQYPQSVGKV